MAENPETRILVITLKIPVRLMNAEELKEANEGDLYDEEAEFEGTSEDTLDDYMPTDIAECIVNGIDAEEGFAGSGMYMKIGDPVVEDVEWEKTSPLTPAAPQAD